MRSFFGMLTLALAATVTATTALAHSVSAPVPAPTIRAIVAEYGSAAYMPKFAPPGFIFTSWRVEQRVPAYLSPALHVTFGRRGTLLVWSVSDKRDSSSYAQCTGRPNAGLTRVISNRRVYYARGNHGDSAWTCLSDASVDLWVANDPGRPSPLVAMQMVASARRAG